MEQSNSKIREGIENERILRRVFIMTRGESSVIISFKTCLKLVSGIIHQKLLGVCGADPKVLDFSMHAMQ